MYIILRASFISSQYLNIDGRRSTTDDVSTIHFPVFLLSSYGLRETPNFIPVHSLMLSSHPIFCLPLLLGPFTVPCRTVFAMTEGLEMWPYRLSIRFFTMDRRSSCNRILNSVANLLVRHMVFVGNVKKSSIVSHLKDSVLLSSSAVKVQLSHAYKNVNKMSVHISLTLETSEMYLSV